MGRASSPFSRKVIYAALNFPKREYSASRGDDLYRRALYTHWQRTFLHPSLLAFDAPRREECTVNRSNSNTPLQALVLLNDPIFVEAARVREEDRGEREEIWTRVSIGRFAQALNRTPDKTERKILTDLYQEQYSGAASSDDETGALTTVARAILNLHETITRN